MPIYLIIIFKYSEPSVKKYHPKDGLNRYQKNLIRQDFINFMNFLERFWGFFNGMIAGVSQVFVMQPFEIIKVRLQTQTKEARLYNGIVDCFKQIVTKEGPLALFKGSATPLIGVGFLGAIRFGIYESFKKDIAYMRGTNGQPAVLSQVDKTLAAFFAGIFTSVGVCFVDHTRIRVQIQKSEVDKIYTGSIDAAVKIYKQYGIRGLNRGQTPTTIRESTSLCLYFTTIQKLTKILAPPDVHQNEVPIYVPLIAGGMGGIAAWMFNYPVDYVKTLMQSDKLGDFKYPTMASVFREQYRLGGWRVFFKGYLICMMRSLPVNSISVAIYRVMQRLTGHVSH